jgi:hypothetical protein
MSTEEFFSLYKSCFTFAYKSKVYDQEPKKHVLDAILHFIGPFCCSLFLYSRFGFDHGSSSCDYFRKGTRPHLIAFQNFDIQIFIKYLELSLFISNKTSYYLINSNK